MYSPTLTSTLAASLGCRSESLALSSVAGGDSATTLHVGTTTGEEFFLKLMPAGSGALAAEADGLEVLAKTGTLRVPAVMARGSCAEGDWLLLEWLRLHDWRPLAGRFAEQLACLHRLPVDGWGWSRDNYIGLSPQPNPATDDWIGFFRDARLGYQLEKARRSGLDGPSLGKLERLMSGLDAFFDGPVNASLLHGDLWIGNVGASDGEPVVFDPAVYCGHHEVDLAMLELFGSPGDAFFDAYRRILPIDPAYRQRRDLYNLYHLLNHYCLFGGGYGQQAGRLAGRLLAELG